MENKLKEMQKIVDKKYETEGLTDEVLEKQLEINKLRHELDIPDPDKKVYENYVQ